MGSDILFGQGTDYGANQQGSFIAVVKMAIKAVFWEQGIMAKLWEVKKVRLFFCDMMVCLWIVSAWNFEGTY